MIAQARPDEPSHEAHPARPRVVVDGEVAALQALLGVERDARTCGTVDELAFLIGNETRRLVNARQIFVLERALGGAFKVKTVSSLAAVDRDSTMIQWIEGIAQAVDGAHPQTELQAFGLPDFSSGDPEMARAYPFDCFLWRPLRARDGAAFAGLLFTREREWRFDDVAVVNRLSDAYAHAWVSLVKPGVLKARRTGRAKLTGAVAAALALAGFIPVDMTALAPAEVVAKHPFVVAASLDGAIESIEVDPNSEVVAGQPLVRFNDTSLKDAYLIAEKAVAVAAAKEKQISQMAFSDPAAKREVAIALSELELKKAERDYALDLLNRSVIRAPRAGIIVFQDKRDLVGRPVAIGQRLMELADRNAVQIKINMPVDDALVLREGARVRVFLDADPLHAIEGVIKTAAHSARVIEGAQLVFRADADLASDGEPAPRLGVRGTAQVFGDKTALFYFLFRRPLSYLRQHFGA